MSHTIVQTDDLDEFDWDTITTTYHPDEVTPSLVVTVFDNGVERRETYRADGSLQTWIEIDFGDLFDWESRAETFDTDGTLSTESQSFDDGYNYINQYIDGLLAVFIEFDGEWGSQDPGQFDWAHRNTHYNTDGEVIGGATTYDNGIREGNIVDGEVEWLHEVEDLDRPDYAGPPGAPPGGLHFWLAQTWELDTDTGEITHEIVLNDGSVATSSFEGSLNGIEVDLDSDDLEDWDTIARFYHADGTTLQHRETIFDDGSVLLESFDETGALNQTVETDEDDEFDWDTITTIYSDDGVTPFRTITVFDNGVERVEGYDSEGNPHVTFEQDHHDIYIWDAYQAYYHSNGVIQSSALDYDDGGFEWNSYYENGQLFSRVLKDTELDGDDPWLYYSEQFNEDGTLSREGWTFDNGSEVGRVNNDGLWWVGAVDFDYPFAELHVPDSDGLHFWMTQTWDQAEDGVTVEHTVVLNDGSEISNSFTGDVETLQVQLDSDDLEDWDTIATTFHEDGTTVEAIETMYDDGVIVTEQFDEAGAPVSETSRDLLDAHDWDVIETVFHNEGSVISRRETWFDDGVYRDEAYRPNGNLILLLDWDLEDAHDWTLMATRYDENGEVTASQIDYDNGYQFVEHFDGGVLFQTWELDGWDTELGEVPGLYDWYFRGTYYDEDGSVLGISTQFDDGVTESFLYEDEILTERWLYDSNHPGFVFEEPVEPIPGGLHDWFEQTWTYDTEGNIVSHRIVWDNGEVTDLTYTETVVTDTEGTKSWETITRRFDFDGEQIFEEIVYDDGRIRTTVWEDGVLASLDWQDPFDARNWETLSYLYDENGKVSLYHAIRDDGSELLETSENGLRTRTIETDPFDAKNWESIETLYDENGKRSQLLTIRDNGVETLERWENGVRTSILETDPFDAKNWESFETLYDENGKRASKVSTYDNGIEKTEIWQDGKRVSILETDALNAASFVLIDTQYDENGLKASKYTLNDDGVEKTETWQDGLRVSILETDDDNAEDWVEISRLYDENGAIASKTTLYDDGRTKTQTWEDGVLVSVIQTDPLNAVDWVDITTLYDVNGDFLSQVKNYDNGDVTEVFVPTSNMWDIDELEAERVTQKSNLGDEKSWAFVETVEFEGKFFLTQIFWDNENESTKFFLPSDDLGDVKYEGVLDLADLKSWEEQSTARLLDLGRKEIYQRDDDQDEDLRHINLETDVLEFHGQKDGSDVEDWAAQHSHYDAAGDLERIETHFDDGHFEITYFSGGVVTGTDILSEAEFEAGHADFYDYWDWYGPIEFATSA